LQICGHKLIFKGGNSAPDLGCVADVPSCPPEALQRVYWNCEVGPNVIVQIENTCCNRTVQGVISFTAACNLSRVAQYDTALIVMLFSMKSTTVHPCSSKNTLPADLPISIFFDRMDPTCFHSSLHVLSPGSDGVPTSRRQRECVRGNQDNEWHIVGGMSTDYSLLLGVFR